MKTIEERARAYDKALETARMIHSGEGVPILPGMSTLEVIFPELAESKDEKIRKELIDIVKEHGCKYQLDMSGHIAWLEKQKCHGRCYDDVEIEEGKAFGMNQMSVGKDNSYVFYGTVRDDDFIDFDESGTSFMIPSKSHDLRNGDNVIVKIVGRGMESGLKLMDEDTVQWIVCMINELMERKRSDVSHCATIEAEISVLKSILKRYAAREDYEFLLDI